MIFDGEATCFTCTNVQRLLILNLVDEAKLELGLHSLFHFVIGMGKIDRNEVGTTRVYAVRKVTDAPFRGGARGMPLYAQAYPCFRPNFFDY